MVLRSMINIILFVVMFIIFIMICSASPPEIKQPLIITPEPISISPSNVRLQPLNNNTILIQPSQVEVRENPIVQRLFSPTSSIVSSIQDINVEYPENKYSFEEAGRKFGSIGEKLCCKILEEYLKRKTILHLRPNFLKNPRTNRNLEIDIYDPITKIAIEYNGAQHYKYVPSMGSDLNYQQWKDNLKYDLCTKEGIFLIVVPYWIDTLNENGKYVRLNQEEREKRLYSFIVPYLDLIFQNITGK